MSEHEEIENQLNAYRKDRDAQSPADPQMLPVQKDRLMAEARRIHGQAARSGFFGLRPVLRWALVAAPVILLALVGYFSLHKSQSIRADHLALRKVSESKQAGLADGRLESSGRPAEQPAAVGLMEKEVADANMPAAPAADTETAAEVAGAMAKTEPAGKAGLEVALLDLSGAYRSRAAATELSRDVLRETPVAGGEMVGGAKSDDKDRSELRQQELDRAGNFANFRLVQTADTVTLVDAAGQTYVGKLVSAPDGAEIHAQKLEMAKNKKAPAQNLIQQAMLVGTNTVTNERMNFLANFFVELPVEEGVGRRARASRRAGVGESRVDESVDELPASDAAAAKPSAAPAQWDIIDRLQEAQSKNIPVQLRVVIERLDADNQPREIVIEAERISVADQP